MNGDIKRLIHFLEKERPTIVFNLCESLLGQAIHEMHVAGIYELMGAPYTGTGTVALGVCLNKVRTKEILSYHHIPTAPYLLVEKGDVLSAKTFSLRFPMIVKPLHEDASSGIENSSVVYDFASLMERTAKVIKAFEQPALVEEYIAGRELNVAVMGNNPPVALPISEIDFSGLPDSYPKIVHRSLSGLSGPARQYYRGMSSIQLKKLPCKHIALWKFGIMRGSIFAWIKIINRTFLRLIRTRIYHATAALHVRHVRQE
jgi:D-alanine-D-alanine ligase